MDVWFTELCILSSPCSAFPLQIFFFCDVPPGPGCGGETAIADVRDIQQRLQPDVLEKFDRLGVMYHRHLPFGANDKIGTWQKVFFTESKREVERHLQNTNSDYRWNSDDSLSLWHVKPAFTKHPNSGNRRQSFWHVKSAFTKHPNSGNRRQSFWHVKPAFTKHPNSGNRRQSFWHVKPAFTKHPNSDEKVWFNQVSLHHASFFDYHPRWVGVRCPGNKYPFHTYYGDGTEIDIGTIQHIRDVIWQVAIGYQPQRGDLLVLDNLHIQHTRLGFNGPRKLYVSMTVD
ncbi:dapdiamide synthesis protein DdaC-like [Glandiceps talaboti]